MLTCFLLSAFRSCVCCVFLWSVAGLLAQVRASENVIKGLRVFSQTPDGTEVVLRMYYQYDGESAPIARINPVILKKDQNGITGWFQSEETTVTRGQGFVSISVKFLKDKPGVPPHVATDQVAIQMLGGNGRVVLATASFPLPLTWGVPPPPEETGALKVPEAAALSEEPPKAEVSEKSEDLEPQSKPARSSWRAKLKSAFAGLGRRKGGAHKPQDAGEPYFDAYASKYGSNKVQDFPDPQDRTELPKQRSGTNTPVALLDSGSAGRGLAPASVDAIDESTAAEAAEPSSGSLSVVAPTKLSAWQERLTLGPGDVLNFYLYGEPGLERTGVAVGYDGRVSFLEAHNVLATGRTIDELRAEFDKELAKFRRAPHTIITPAAYHSKKYYVLGKIAKAGVFPLDQPLTVIQAVARAGGLATGLTGGNVMELADLSRSFLVRQGERTAVDLEKLFQEGDLSQNVALEPNDYLFFAAGETKEIYVLGEVNRAGPVPFLSDLTAVRAIALAGSFTDRAWTRRILVIRGSLHQPETFVVNAASVLSSKAPDVRLQSKDIVYVSHRPWIKAEELLDAAATAFVQAAVVVWTGGHVTPIGR